MPVPRGTSGLEIAPNGAGVETQGMQDRLGDLRRQRELVAEHLRWLDGEIAAATPAPLPAPTTAPAPLPALTNAAAAAPIPAIPAPPPPPPLAATPATSPASAPQAALPDVDARSIKEQTQRGCLLYVVVGSLVLVGAAWLLVSLSRGSYAQDHRKTPPAAERPSWP